MLMAGAAHLWHQAYGGNFKMITAGISEIFVSIQGEGLYCGQKQVFLRFAGCNLRCAYCDEPAALEKRRQAPSCGGKPQVSGHKSYIEMSVPRAAAEIIRLAGKNRARAVSLTGGEPLLNWGFIRALAPALRKAGLAVHLETNGTRYRELLKVKNLVDVIAMDIKLPSSTGQAPLWREHGRFLSVAPGKTFIKTVVTSKTRLSEFKKAVGLTAAVSGKVPFFIQPVTGCRGKAAGGGKRRFNATRLPSGIFLEKACCLAAARLSTARLLPQQHPKWGIK